MKSRRDKGAAAYIELAGDDDDGLADAKAPRTWVLYRSGWRRFVSWCQENGVASMPADGPTLKRYLREMNAANLSAATIEAYIAGIATVHRIHGHAINRTILVEPLKAARRRAGPARRAQPMLADELRQILARLDRSKALDARDGALLCFGWAAALRGAELVSLDWLRSGGRTAGGAGFVTREPAGHLVTLLSSKSAQVTPTSIAIPSDEMPSLEGWLDAWVAVSQVQPGEALFRPVRAGRVGAERLAIDAVAKIVKRRMLDHYTAAGLSLEEASLAARAYSGHSLRRGYCTSAAMSEVPEWAIRSRSRHRSAAMVARYIGLAESWHQSGLRGVGF